MPRHSGGRPAAVLVLLVLLALGVVAAAVLYGVSVVRRLTPTPPGGGAPACAVAEARAATRQAYDAAYDAYTAAERPLLVAPAPKRAVPDTADCAADLVRLQCEAAVLDRLTTAVNRYHRTADAYRTAAAQAGAPPPELPVRPGGALPDTHLERLVLYPAWTARNEEGLQRCTQPRAAAETAYRLYREAAVDLPSEPEGAFVVPERVAAGMMTCDEQQVEYDGLRCQWDERRRQLAGCAVQLAECKRDTADRFAAQRQAARYANSNVAVFAPGFLDPQQAARMTCAAQLAECATLRGNLAVGNLGPYTVM